MHSGELVLLRPRRMDQEQCRWTLPPPPFRLHRDLAVFFS
jgi:hypothetical protein